MHNSYVDDSLNRSFIKKIGTKNPKNKKIKIAETFYTRWRHVFFGTK
jgi:hypothetical protein